MRGAYYNEHDAFAAAWLRELIAAGLIAPGDVDERSIADVCASDLDGYTQCHFFAGIGGWSLALRLAGWPDDRSVWTGSCPCQPFSAAGKRKGFADERHLWPVWKELIAERLPSVCFGEQVASASAWLGLVRGDLEALGYAVGAIPIEAASAGADHLRDRFWFVADGSHARKHGSGAAGPRGRHEHPDGRGDGAMAHADDARSQGRTLLPERAGERAARPDGVADADQPLRRIANEQPAGQLAQQQQDQGARDSGDVADGYRNGAGDGPGRRAGAQEASRLGSEQEAPRPVDAARIDGSHEWVLGADGKARRVKSGVRLLVDGFPARVGLLRGFGNAIDPRPAAQFIAAAEEAMRDAA